MRNQPSDVENPADCRFHALEEASEILADRSYNEVVEYDVKVPSTYCVNAGSDAEFCVAGKCSAREAC